MKADNASFFADLYRRVGERFGLLEGDQNRVGLTAEQMARRAKAIQELEAIQMGWRKQGLTAKDIRDAIREGRS